MNKDCDNPPCTYYDASVTIFIATCRMHDYDEDRTVRSVKSEAELAVDVL